MGIAGDKSRCIYLAIANPVKPSFLSHTVNYFCIRNAKKGSTGLFRFTKLSFWDYAHAAIKQQ